MTKGIPIEDAIRILDEMQLNYSEQYPKVVPNMDLVIKIMEETCGK